MVSIGSIASCITWNVIGTCTFLAIVALFLCWYLGMMTPIKFEDAVQQPIVIAYSVHKGPYKKIGNAFCQTHDKLRKYNIISQTENIGIYFDNPNIVKEKDLTSWACYIIQPDVLSKADIMKSLNDENLNVTTLPLTKIKCCHFPWVNFLSFIIGAMRVYPKASSKDLIKSASLEFYDPNTKMIKYVFPQDNIDSYTNPSSLTSSFSPISSTTSSTSTTSSVSPAASPTSASASRSKKKL